MMAAWQRNGGLNFFLLTPDPLKVTPPIDYALNAKSAAKHYIIGADISSKKRTLLTE